MRTKVEIERSKAEMERMADDALRGLAKAKEMNATVLVKHFELWHERSKARAQILSWVLGQELNEDVPPQLPQAHVSGWQEFGKQKPIEGEQIIAVHADGDIEQWKYKDGEIEEVYLKNWRWIYKPAFR